MPLAKHRIFSHLVGLVLKDIRHLQKDSNAVFFYEESGKTFVMQHHQDCCESVYVYDVVGDYLDLIGSPILRAEERSSSDLADDPRDPESRSCEESFTWTFYEIATISGSVTIRWFGASNGYYSEGVSFEEMIDEYSEEKNKENEDI